jgi:four helix bundle protein
LLTLLSALQVPYQLSRDTVVDEQTFKRDTKSIAILAFRLAQTLPSNAAANELGRQFLQCATAVGMPCRHADRWGVPSEMNVMLRETIHAAEECLYRLELLADSALVQRDRAEAMAEEIMVILDMAVQALRQQQNGRIALSAEKTIGPAEAAESSQ